MAGLMPADNVVADDDDEPNVTPEEQAAYDDLVSEARTLLYAGGKVRDGILEMLDEDPSDLKESLGEISETWDQPDPNDPEGKTLWEAQQSIISLAATSVIVLLEAVEKTGIMEKMGEDAGSIIFRAGEEILEDIADLAEKAGIHDYSEEEIGEAFRKGADLYREAAEGAGLIDKEAATGEFNEIVTADKEGRLNDVVPGLAQPEEQQMQEPMQ